MSRGRTTEKPLTLKGSYRHDVLGSLRKKVRLLRSLSRTELTYLELHLTDHCNLRCKGCYHYSSISPKRFTDPYRYKQDMQRLSELFPTVRTIRLMGGEPLLHPEADRFIRTTREAFPYSHIRFVTNGILLPKATQAFWDACRETNTIIDLTLYPPTYNFFDNYCSLCKNNSVRLSSRYVDTFNAYGNLKGDSQKRKAFNLCRIGFYCVFLYDGRLYTCAMPALVHCFNEKFGYDVPADEGTDIHSQCASGRNTIMRLSKAIDTCKWCAYESVPFKWTSSNYAANEWDAEEHRIKMKYKPHN